MVFKKMLRAMGVGGPSVETVLANPNCRPGGFLEGQVHVQGGDHAVDVEYLAVGLITRVEVETGDSEYNTDQEFHRQRLTGSFRLDPGARYDVPFHFDVVSVVVAMVAMALLANAAGWLASLKILDLRPLEVLRAE